ncbi:MAG: MGMT family protein [Propionibacterium sp.]|nr:MGMT family protein [Propionibacterium sp.]
MTPDEVYTVARLVPSGRVVSYGDIAALFDANPRQVGSHLGRCNAPGVPWWRVTNASGRLPAHLVAEAAAHWRAEGTPCRADGSGVHMGRARADLPALADAAELALGPLPGLRGPRVEPAERPVGD